MESPVDALSSSLGCDSQLLCTALFSLVQMVQLDSLGPEFRHVPCPFYNALVHLWSLMSLADQLQQARSICVSFFPPGNIYMLMPGETLISVPKQGFRSLELSWPVSHPSLPQGKHITLLSAVCVWTHTLFLLFSTFHSLLFLLPLSPPCSVFCWRNC